MRIKNPGAIIEDTIRTHLLEEYFSRIGSREVLLDVGCGSRPYLRSYKKYYSKTIGADLADSPFDKYKVDIFCEATNIPLESSSIDVHFSSEVLHDIAEPSRLMEEAYRLLRPGGYIILTSPFMVPICDGIYDHYRYTRYGLQYLFSKAGFTEIGIKENGGLFATIIQLSVKPHLRFWNKVSKKIHLPFFRTFWNPFLFLFVMLPQLLYLGYYFGSEKLPVLRKLRNVYPNSPIGYVCIAKKPG